MNQTYLKLVKKYLEYFLNSSSGLSYPLGVFLSLLFHLAGYSSFAVFPLAMIQNPFSLAPFWMVISMMTQQLTGAFVLCVVLTILASCTIQIIYSTQIIASLTLAIIVAGVAYLEVAAESRAVVSFTMSSAILIFPILGLTKIPTHVMTGISAIIILANTRMSQYYSVLLSFFIISHFLSPKLKLKNIDRMRFNVVLVVTCSLLVYRYYFNNPSPYREFPKQPIFNEQYKDYGNGVFPLVNRNVAALYFPPDLTDNEAIRAIGSFAMMKENIPLKIYISTPLSEDIIERVNNMRIPIDPTMVASIYNVPYEPSVNTVIISAYLSIRNDLSFIFDDLNNISQDSCSMRRDGETLMIFRRAFDDSLIDCSDLDYVYTSNWATDFHPFVYSRSHFAMKSAYLNIQTPVFQRITSKPLNTTRRVLEDDEAAYIIHVFRGSKKSDMAKYQAEGVTALSFHRELGTRFRLILLSDEEVPDYIRNFALKYRIEIVINSEPKVASKFQHPVFAQRLAMFNINSFLDKKIKRFASIDSDTFALENIDHLFELPGSLVSTFGDVRSCVQGGMWFADTVDAETYAAMREFVKDAKNCIVGDDRISTDHRKYFPLDDEGFLMSWYADKGMRMYPKRYNLLGTTRQEPKMVHIIHTKPFKDLKDLWNIAQKQLTQRFLGLYENHIY